MGEECWEIELPNAIQCADGSWTKSVVLSEMVGEDEDLLVDTTRAPGGKGTLAKSGPRRVTEILSRCTVAVGLDTRPEGKTRFHLPDFFTKTWEKAFSSDRSFAMIRLRQLSLGSEYTFSESCPKCNKEIKRITLDLKELEVKSFSLEHASLDSRVTDLPKTGHKVEWRFLTGKDETVLEELARTHKADFLSVVAAQRIVQVDGAPVNKMDFVRRLPAGDRNCLRESYDESEGGIETSIEIVCDNCEAEFSRKISVMGKTDFFFPSVGKAAPTGNSSTRALSPKPGDGPLPSSTDSP